MESTGGDTGSYVRRRWEDGWRGEWTAWMRYKAWTVVSTYGLYDISWNLEVDIAERKSLFFFGKFIFIPKTQKAELLVSSRNQRLPCPISRTSSWQSNHRWLYLWWIGNRKILGRDAHSQPELSHLQTYAPWASLQLVLCYLLCCTNNRTCGAV